MLTAKFPILIYVVAGSQKTVAILLTITLLSWWFFCDYFVSPQWWSPSWEHAGFLLFPAVWILVLWVRELLRLRATRARSGNRLTLVHPDHTFQAAAWRQMIQVIAFHPDSRSKQFLSWQAARIGSLPADTYLNCQQVRLWWTDWRLAGWAVAPVWLPLLCVGLIAGPLHTSMMEVIAQRLSKERQNIFAVDYVGRDLKTRRLFREPLWELNGGFIRAGISSHIATGLFEVTSTRFPRVYRTLAARCDQHCQLLDPRTPLPVLNVSPAVTTGTAMIEWVQTAQPIDGDQTTPQPRLHLVLRLLGAGGTCVDQTVIEP